MDARRRRLSVSLVLALAAGAAVAPAHADRVRLLTGDVEAAEARVEMVLGAQRELLVSAFIFGDDPFTLTSLGLLREAARRGVAVRLLADAQWNAIPRAVAAHLVAEGIEIREYHPFRLDQPLRVVKRMHDKLVIADGERVLGGGRNVESPYFGFGRQIGRRNYLDADLLVEGDAAAEARRYFVELWESGRVHRRRRQVPAGEIAAAAKELDRHYAWLAARIDEARRDPTRAPASWVEVGAVRFVHDPIRKRDKVPRVGAVLGEILEGAVRSVVVESPYLVTTRAIREGLKRTLARGVGVRILTNSLGTTDNLWPQAGYQGEKDDLVRGGVELWEYQGPECLHSKTAVIDERTVIVGSYNLDPRSQRLNREVALIVESAELAADLLRRMNEHLERSARIDERGYPAGASERFPGIPRCKVFKLRLLRVIAPLVRSQL
jgi:phosphatidylserine/phosphatidylglycerophosphate/cardiolipin synthase-like enzyme